MYYKVYIKKPMKKTNGVSGDNPTQTRNNAKILMKSIRVYN